MTPESGRLYRCKTIHGSIRVLRYGYHRKNNDSNWSNANPGVSLLWFGWRDHANFRFLRPEEVMTIIEAMERSAE